MRQFEPFPRTPYGQPPRSAKILTFFKSSKAAWATLGITILCCGAVWPHASGLDIWVMSGFTALIAAMAVGAGVHHLKYKGIEYTVPLFDTTVIVKPGAEDAYLPPEILGAKMLRWCEFWAAHPDTKLTREQSIRVLKKLTLIIDPKPIDVSDQYPDLKIAKAATDRKFRVVYVWMEQSQNWFGTMEYEWGHLHADAEWGYSTESEMLEKRKNHGLLNSRKEGE